MSSQLKWACRRGMLELDILLNRFLEKQYPYLSNIEQQTFIQLLSYQDPDLYHWLMGVELPEDSALAALILRIRECE